MYKNCHKETWARSVVKAVAYRVIIIALDFAVVYFLTRRTDIALGFVVASNVYTTLAYYLHERAWNSVAWGKISIPEKSGG